jgi:hypothetical protein
MNIIESGKTLGARIEGLDLSVPLTEAQFVQHEQALGHCAHWRGGLRLARW